MTIRHIESIHKIANIVLSFYDIATNVFLSWIFETEDRVVDVENARPQTAVSDT